MTRKNQKIGELVAVRLFLESAPLTATAEEGDRPDVVLVFPGVDQG